jgi:hypothetical protein
MLSWLNPPKSAALANAQARARERAEQEVREQASAYSAPSQDGLVVEEVSAEEFMRLFQQRDRAA